MTFAEVKEILEKANFNMDDCSILDSPTVKAGSGVVVRFENGVYKIYDTERNEAFDIVEHTSEDAACREFLKRIIDSFGKFYDLPKDIL